MTDRDREPMVTRVCADCRSATFHVRQPKRIGHRDVLIRLELVCAGCGVVSELLEKRD